MNTQEKIALPCECFKQIISDCKKITDRMAKLNFSLSIHDDKGNFYIKRAVGKCILRQHNRYARISRTLRGDLYKFGRLQFEKEAFLCDFSTGAGFT